MIPNWRYPFDSLAWQMTQSYCDVKGGNAKSVGALTNGQTLVMLCREHTQYLLGGKVIDLEGAA